MHPIERLRYVARASGVDQRVLVTETATALRGLGIEPAGLVTSARRIVERHPSSGPLWWLCARVLAAADPFREAARCVEEIGADPTVGALVGALPDAARVALVGAPGLAVDALARRGDATVLVIGDGRGVSEVARRLERGDVEHQLVPAAAAGPAVAAADVVLVETTAISAAGAVCPMGSAPLGALAGRAGTAVWLVAGVGRRLPAPLWHGVVQRMSAGGRPGWQLDDEVVGPDTAIRIVGPSGVAPWEPAAVAAECPVTPELLPVPERS